MTEATLMMLEHRHGLRVTDSTVRGLHYIAADGDNRIAIATRQGVVLLSKRQAQAVVKELMKVYEYQVET